MSKEKVLIIGAGPAGLTAGYTLLSSAPERFEVTILEAGDAVGGISQTVAYKGNRMDLGGHRFFSKIPRVTELWEKLMPTQGAPSLDDKKLGREKKLVCGGPDPEKTDKVMLVRQRVSRIYYEKHFFDYPISMKWQTFANMGLKKTVKSGFSYMKSVVAKKPENNLENFYINRFGKQLYSMFFEGYTEKLWGRHPRDISADWGAQRVKGLSIRAVLKDMLDKVFHVKNKKVETSLIEEFVYPKYGPGQLWETMADEFTKMGGRLIKKTSVTGLKLSEEGRIASVMASFEGQDITFTPDHVFSSMPVKDLVGGMEGPVPENVREVAAGLPYRDFVTVGLLLDRLNLKNKTSIATLQNIVPDCWIYVQDVGVKLGRIQIFNNWSPYLVKDPENRVWIGLEYFCDEGDAFWNLSDEETVKLAVKELVKMGVLTKDCHVYDAHREKVKKAYPAYFDTYSRFDELESFLKTIPNLYCIGRNGQHRYNNMDHSMVTAFVAADSVLTGKPAQDELWSVNTEKEYHEEKKN